jgi:hypothetical protein
MIDLTGQKIGVTLGLLGTSDGLLKVSGSCSGSRTRKAGHLAEGEGKSDGYGEI